MIDDAIKQIYCTSPDRQTFLQDLATKDLAEENENGTLVPVMPVTTWTPRDGEATDDEGETIYTYADSILTVLPWTDHAAEVRGTGNLISALRKGGPFPGGTEVEVNLNNLGFHATEPRIGTYGAPRENVTG